MPPSLPPRTNTAGCFVPGGSYSRPTRPWSRTSVIVACEPVHCRVAVVDATIVEAIDASSRTSSAPVGGRGKAVPSGGSSRSWMGERGATASPLGSRFMDQNRPMASAPA